MKSKQLKQLEAQWRLAKSAYLNARSSLHQFEAMNPGRNRQAESDRKERQETLAAAESHLRAVEEVLNSYNANPNDSYVQFRTTALLEGRRPF